MLMLSKKPWLWSFVAVLALVVYLVSCDDNPTKPQPVPDEPRDYPIYFCDLGKVADYKLLVYYPISRRIDSMDIPWEPLVGITVSADGKLLYLALQQSVVVVDTDSLSLVVELPYGPDSPVAVSPDNQLVAITGSDLYILRTTDYQVIFHDTARTVRGWFSSDSKTFYCTAAGGSEHPSSAYKLDLADSAFSITKRLFSDGGVMQIVPTVDESRWLLYLIAGTYLYAFEVYDVLADSIVFAQGLSPGVGKIAIMPNGKYAFYGNPGSILMGPPAPSEFTVFDIKNNRIDEVVNTEAFIDSLTPYYFPVGSMVVTPDNRWLIAQDAVPPHSVLLYDIENRELVDYHTLGLSNVELGNLTVQKQE